MSSLTQETLSAISSELHVNADGEATCSLRGASRLADVNPSTLSKALHSGVALAPQKLAKHLIAHGFQGVALEAWTIEGIPDIALAHILEYYGYLSEQRASAMARDCCKAFMAIGIRTWIQQVKGWVKPQFSTPQDTALALAAQVTDIVQDAYERVASYNPRIAQMIADHAANQLLLPSAGSATEDLRGVVELAEAEGYRLTAGQKSQLGKYVYKIVGTDKEEERLCNGRMTKIKLYRDTPSLRQVINNYLMAA